MMTTGTFLPNLYPAPTLFGAAKNKKTAAAAKKAPAKASRKANAKTPATSQEKQPPVKQQEVKSQAPLAKPATRAPKKDWDAYYTQLEAASKPAPTPFDKLPIQGTEIIVYDLETTGLYARGDKPSDPVPEGGWDDLVEVSAIKYKDGQVIDRFYGLVNPRKTIPPEVEALSNYKLTNAKVKAEGLPTEVVVTRFFEFIGKEPLLVGHNAKWFDTKFMRAICDRYNFPEFKDRLNYDRIVDTKIIAQKMFPELVWKKDENGNGIPPTPGPDSPQSAKLTKIAEFFGFNTDGAHEAENDVAMCAKIFYKMVEKMGEKGVPNQTFGDIYQYQFTPFKRRSGKKPGPTPAQTAADAK
jgi:DNA polymerase III epsilon subunit-like protein